MHAISANWLAGSSGAENIIHKGQPDLTPTKSMKIQFLSSPMARMRNIKSASHGSISLLKLICSATVPWWVLNNMCIASTCEHKPFYNIHDRWEFPSASNIWRSMSYERYSNIGGFFTLRRGIFTASPLSQSALRPWRAYDKLQACSGFTSGLRQYMQHTTMHALRHELWPKHIAICTLPTSNILWK